MNTLYEHRRSALAVCLSVVVLVPFFWVRSSSAHCFAAVATSSQGPAPSSPAASCTALPQDAVSFVSTPGTPFEPIPSSDGCWVFVSLTNNGEVAAFRRDAGKLKLQRTVKLPRSPTGMVLTHDGQYLLAATDDSVSAVNVATLMAGVESPPVLTIGAGQFDGAIYVNVTHDDAYLFVANEGGGAISVVDLKQARANGFKSSSVIGRIPAGGAPIAVTLSADDKRLYSTSEVAARSLGALSDCATERPGEVEVIDLARAIQNPAQSVISVAPGGCSPVRLVLSDDGATAYVTARGENAVLAFDTDRLVSDPAHALLARAPAGTAPVGVAVAAGRLIVAGSNRFGRSNQAAYLTVLSSDWRTWTPPVSTAQLAAGSFPREERLSADGTTLYVTNFDSQQLEMVDLTRLPPLVAASPH
jgi:DNA-binding beta-propeller fold protein YncE